MSNRNFLASIWSAEFEQPIVKFVLLAIAQNATRDGVVRMSISKITRATSLDELSIYNSILTLHDTGWLSVQIGTGDQILEKSKKTEYLASLVRAVERGDQENIPDTVPHEPWFFCINRSIRPPSSAIA